MTEFEAQPIEIKLVTVIPAATGILETPPENWEKIRDTSSKHYFSIGKTERECGEIGYGVF